MTLWSTRDLALAALEGPLCREAKVLQDAFDLADECIRRLEALDTPFAKVCALTLIKSRNLALGCYGLCLDGLAQEAGALFRPLIETLELATYFRLEPARIDEALEDRLPQAGVIASRIEGDFKEVRNYLNNHASHYSFSAESMRHLVDFRLGSFKLVQPHSDNVLRLNLHLLLGIFVRVAIEATNCVSVGSGRVDGALADRAEELRDRFGDIAGVRAAQA